MPGQGQIDLRAVYSRLLCLFKLVNSPIEQADNAELLALFRAVKLAFGRGLRCDRDTFQARDGLCGLRARLRLLTLSPTFHRIKPLPGKIAVPVRRVAIHYAFVKST